MMKKLLQSAVLALSISIVVYVVARDWPTVRLALAARHAPALLLHLAALVATFAGLTLGWHWLLRLTGARWSVRTSAMTWNLPNIGKYMPGKVLMYAGRIELCRRENVGRGLGLNLLVIENLFQVTAAAPFLALALVGIDPDGMGRLPWVLGALLAIGGGFVLAPRGYARLAAIPFRLMRKTPPDLNLRRSTMLALMGWYLMTWTVYGLSGAALCACLGLGGQVPVGVAIDAFVAAWLLGFLAFVTPAGLGVREAALSLLLAPYVPAATAVTLAVLARISWTLTEMSGVLLAVWLQTQRRS